MLAGMMMLKLFMGNINMLVLFITAIITGLILYVISYFVIDRTVFVELKSMLKGS